MFSYTRNHQEFVPNSMVIIPSQSAINTTPKNSIVSAYYTIFLIRFQKKTVRVHLGNFPFDATLVIWCYSCHLVLLLSSDATLVIWCYSCQLWCWNLSKIPPIQRRRCSPNQWPQQPHYNTTYYSFFVVLFFKYTSYCTRILQKNVRVNIWFQVTFPKPHV